MSFWNSSHISVAISHNTQWHLTGTITLLLLLVHISTILCLMFTQVLHTNIYSMMDVGCLYMYNDCSSRSLILQLGNDMECARSLATCKGQFSFFVWNRLHASSASTNQPVVVLQSHFELRLTALTEDFALWDAVTRILACIQVHWAVGCVYLCNSIVKPAMIVVSFPSQCSFTMCKKWLVFTYCKPHLTFVSHLFLGAWKATAVYYFHEKNFSQLVSETLSKKLGSYMYIQYIDVRTLHTKPVKSAHIPLYITGNSILLEA